MAGGGLTSASRAVIVISVLFQAPLCSNAFLLSISPLQSEVCRSHCFARTVQTPPSVFAHRVAVKPSKLAMQIAEEAVGEVRTLGADTNPVYGDTAGATLLMEDVTVSRGDRGQ